LQKDEQLDLDELVLSAVISANTPFTFAENDEWRAVFDFLGATLPSRKRLSHMVDEMYEECEKKMTVKLKQADAGLNLTTDSATSRAGDGYEAVTAHYISPDWKLHRAVLGVVPTDESHTGTYLASVVKGAVEKHPTIDDAVFGITTDNASNVVKMSRELQEENMVHEHHRCCCHTLHLCVTHAMKIDAVQPLLDRAKNIVNTIRRSNLCTTTLLEQQREMKHQQELKFEDIEEEGAAEDPMFEKRPLKLLIDCATRWSSVYLMLQRLCHLKDPVISTLQIHAHHDKLLSASEWEDLQQLVKLLEPIAHAVRTLEGDLYPTLSLSWQLILSVSRYLRGRTAHFPMYPDWSQQGAAVNAVREALLAEMGKPDRFRQPTEAMKIAATLDPRRKGLLFLQAQADRDNVYELLLAKLRDEFPRADEPPVAEEKKDEAIDLLALPQVVEVADTLAVEVTRYRATPECGEKDHPLEWWSRHAEGFPHVAKFARRYLALPASSAPSERVFSRLNLTVSSRRASLHPAKVEKMILLYENRHLVK